MVVQQYEVKVGFRIELLQRLPTAGRLQYIDAFAEALENLAQSLAHQGVVVYYKDFHGGGGSARCLLKWRNGSANCGCLARDKSGQLDSRSRFAILQKTPTKKPA
jgi:hypothetical protein